MIPVPDGCERRPDTTEQTTLNEWQLSMAAPHRKRDGRPHADASPDDPGAIVRWSMDGEQFAVACDRSTSLRDNVWKIGLYIKEMRKMGEPSGLPRPGRVRNGTATEC